MRRDWIEYLREVWSGSRNYRLDPRQFFPCSVLIRPRGPHERISLTQGHCQLQASRNLVVDPYLHETALECKCHQSLRSRARDLQFSCLSVTGNVVQPRGSYRYLPIFLPALAMTYPAFFLMGRLVRRLAYNGDVAAGQLAVFQGASEAPISEFIRVDPPRRRKNSQPAAARRVALKMGRRLRCSSVMYRLRYAPSSRLADGPF